MRRTPRDPIYAGHAAREVLKRYGCCCWSRQALHKNSRFLVCSPARRSLSPPLHAGHIDIPDHGQEVAKDQT
jgi:hypothetical protein